jgi:hypothetical protein
VLTATELVHTDRDSGRGCTSTASRRSRGRRRRRGGSGRSP